ncbi:MAG: hypothetical protein ABEH77_07440 [Halobacteriaceae archaeon]
MSRTPLPDRLSAEEFARVVEEADTVLEVQRATRLPRADVKEAIRTLGLEGEFLAHSDLLHAIRNR